MSKFKVTIIEQNTGRVAAEIIESPIFPYISFPLHSLNSGSYGTVVKVELVLDALKQDIFDDTGNE